MRKNDSAQVMPLNSVSENDLAANVPEEIKLAVQKAKGQLDRGEGIEHSQIMAKMKARFLNK